MNPLQLIWNRLNARYLAMSRRERLLLALALVIGPLLLGYSFLLDPQHARFKTTKDSIAADSASLARLQAEAANLQRQLNSDPDAGRKAELAALSGQRDKLDEQLRQFSSLLVRPEEMNGLLEHILTRNSALKLVSLKTLAPHSVLAADVVAKAGENKPTARSFDLYRHGVEICLEGNYAQLEAYLSQLEKLQQRLLWGQLSYRVIEYPRAEMTLVIYTLSPDRAWLVL